MSAVTAASAGGIAETERRRIMDAVVQFACAVFVCLSAGGVIAALGKLARPRIYNRRLER